MEQKPKKKINPVLIQDLENTIFDKSFFKNINSPINENCNFRNYEFIVNNYRKLFNLIKLIDDQKNEDITYFHRTLLDICRDFKVGNYVNYTDNDKLELLNSGIKVTNILYLLMDGIDMYNTNNSDVKLNNYNRKYLKLLDLIFENFEYLKSDLTNK